MLALSTDQPTTQPPSPSLPHTNKQEQDRSIHPPHHPKQTMSNGTTTTTAAAAVPEGVLLGMGNPLLDISADVPQAVLDKYVSKGTYVCLYVVVFFFLRK